MNSLPHLGRDVRKSFTTALAAAVLASAAPIGCGPPDAGTVKAPSKDELTKDMFPESKTRSGKKIEGGSQAVPIPTKK